MVALAFNTCISLFVLIHRLFHKNNMEDKLTLIYHIIQKENTQFCQYSFVKICTGMQGRITVTMRSFNPCDKCSHNINIHDLYIKEITQLKIQFLAKFSPQTVRILHFCLIKHFRIIAIAVTKDKVWIIFKMRKSDKRLVESNYY